MTPDQAAAYLAAFIDGEGHVGVHPKRKGPDPKIEAFPCITESLPSCSACPSDTSAMVQRQG
jgi:hypothetical protein